MIRFGRIIANTRPGNVEIYLDGEPVLDSLGKIAKTPTMILNVQEGIHTLTFGKEGFDNVTLTVNVREEFDSDVRAILNISQIRYPMMLSSLSSLQPSPGWPALPIPQKTYGHIVANTIPDGAEVYIDGQPVFDTVGRVVITPVTILDVFTGVHKVTFKKDGYFDESIDVLIQNGLYSDASAVLRLRIPIYESNISNEILNSPTNPNPIPLKWYIEPDYTNYLQPRQQGIVHFDTSPHGAIIIVDGQYIIDPDTEEYIRTPATVLLFEGRRDFVLKLENHHDVSGYIDVFAGSRVDIFRNMEPIPGSNIRSMYLPYPYYPGYGDLHINSNPQGGYIYIDSYPLLDQSGNAILTPVNVTGLMEGLHEIRIVKDGYYEKQLIVNIISGQNNRAFANLRSIYE